MISDILWFLQKMVRISKTMRLGQLHFLLLSITLLFTISTVQAQNGNRPLEILLAPAVDFDADIMPQQMQSQWKGRSGKGIRSRNREINPSFKQRRKFNKGERVSLQLFDDTQVTAAVEEDTTNENGTQITSAKIEGSEWGRVFIATTGDTVTAKIIIPEVGKFFAIQKNKGDNKHYTVEIDPSQAQYDSIGIPTLEYSGPLLADQLDLPVVSEDESVDETSVVDVMVIYTSGAVADVGSVEEVNNLIALGMAFGNDAHTNTGTGIYLNLVHSQQITYANTDDRSTDLTWLKTNGNDGTVDVQTLRDDHGADFVVMMVGDYSSDGGIASLLGNSSGDQSVAYSVVTSPAFDSYTPVHEIGHNMGLSHAKDQNYQAGPTTWYIDTKGFGSTSAGWHWHPTPGQTGYASIMSYTHSTYFADNLGHTRVGLFSDPGILDHGLPSGDATDGDNAKVLRALKTTYAAYRTRPVSISPITLDSPNGGEALTAGENYSILWNSSGVSGNVKIDLYQNGSFNRAITSSTLNDRMYSWTVPGDLNGYNYTIRISNLSETKIGESNAGFTINSIFYSEPLNTTPGYTTGTNWEFGAPVVPGNTDYGGPGTPYSGSNIYDTDLDGNMSSSSSLTSTAIDCSNYAAVQLSFMGWFSVTSDYDARVEISNDNSTWHSLYQGSDLWKTIWSRHSYDISTYADGESTVYIRWSHVKTGGNSIRSGMSVDDIQLRGVYNSAPVQVNFSNGSAYSPPAPIANTINNPIAKFTMTAADTGVIFTALNIVTSGSRQGVNTLKLYQSTDTIFSPGSDTLLDTASDGSTVTFNGFSEAVTTSAITYFITADLTVDATGTITPVIAANTDITLSSGEISSSFTNAPLSSSAVTISSVNEMTITGNGSTITDGDSIPSSVDNTDFGNVNIVSDNSVKSFTIENLGGATLNLVGSPRVQVSGANSGDFSVTSSPASSLAGGTSTSFQVTFNPSSAGTRSATLSIANDDSNENPYNFSIQGAGVATPEINITGNGTTIVDGDATPTLSDHTDFGSIAAASGTIVRTFTIANSGTAALNLTGSPRVDLSGSHVSDFSVSVQPLSPISVGSSTTFQVTFSPSAVGQRTAALSIASDDSNENPYNFSLCGTGSATPDMTITGNGITIVNGDATPSSTDNSDFAQTDILHGTAIRSFTIVNTGTGTLNLTGVPALVAISGPHANEFEVTSLPDSTVSSNGGTTIFEITFNPIASGLRTATVSITNNDSNKSPYTFAIQGTGGAYAEIDVLGNGMPISSGDTSPNTADLTDFKNVDVTSGSITQMFSIVNQGSKTLSLSGSPYVVITGDSSDFIVTTSPSPSIGAAGGDTTFGITFNPTNSGVRTATVSIANNDGDENPFTFTIQGTGLEVSAVTTRPVTSISASTAELHGNLVALGYPNPSSYGFVWNTENLPDLSDNVIDLGTTEATGEFSTTLSNLFPSTTYYFSSYATNSSGTIYGTVVEFTTGEKETSFCFPVKSLLGKVVIICM